MEIYSVCPINGAYIYYFDWFYPLHRVLLFVYTVLFLTNIYLFFLYNF